MARAIEVAREPRFMGKQEQHFSFNAAQGGTICRAVVFSQPQLLIDIDKARPRWDIAFTCSENDYHSPPRLSMEEALRYLHQALEARRQRLLEDVANV